MQIFEWHRILFGDAPPSFLFEVFLRSILMYTALLATLRLLGKRMSAQLSITELAVIISVGAIVSLPMESPQRGVLNGAVLLVLILALQRALGFASFKSSRVERVLYGNMSTLVQDGILQIEVMRKEGITRDQLFAKLRNKEIDQLGQVERVYLEANGGFSIFLSDRPRAGLSTLPGKDGAYLGAQGRHDGHCVCSRCGAEAVQHRRQEECPKCHFRHWTAAVL